MVKHYLDQKKQPYQEIDITRDPAAALWITSQVGQAVTPVIDIDGTVIVGFDRTKLDLVLRERQR